MIQCTICHRPLEEKDRFEKMVPNGKDYCVDCVNNSLGFFKRRGEIYLSHKKKRK